MPTHSRTFVLIVPETGKGRQMSDMIEFENERFGRIEVEESKLLHFPGLPGFPEARRFVVMEHDHDAPFGWLVSVDDAELAFVITDPWQFFPDYRPPLELSHLQALGVEKPEDLVIMTIATIGGRRPTLNLIAPLLLNATRGRGEQVILDCSDYSYRTEIPAPEASE